MSEKEKIVIFDMDGTLVDSSYDITVSINFVRRKKGLDDLDVDKVVRAINSKETKLAEIFYETREFEKKDKSLFEDHYWDQCIQNITVYPDIEDVLKTMKKKNFNLSIATNARTIFAKKMMKTTKLDQYFDYILGSCDVKNSKPDPEMINKILRKYRFSFETFSKPTFVGDSHKDINAANKARIHSIQVKWGFTNEDIDDTLIAHTPKELIKILETL